MWATNNGVPDTLGPAADAPKRDAIQMSLVGAISYSLYGRPSHAACSSDCEHEPHHLQPLCQTTTQNSHVFLGLPNIITKCLHLHEQLPF